MNDEPAVGICGGTHSIEAYLLYMGVDSLEEIDELDEAQLSLWEETSYERAA